MTSLDRTESDIARMKSFQSLLQVVRNPEADAADAFPVVPDKVIDDWWAGKRNSESGSEYPRRGRYGSSYHPTQSLFSPAVGLETPFADETETVREFERRPLLKSVRKRRRTSSNQQQALSDPINHIENRDVATPIKRNESHPPTNPKMTQQDVHKKSQSRAEVVSPKTEKDNSKVDDTSLPPGALTPNTRKRMYEQAQVSANKFLSQTQKRLENRAKIMSSQMADPVSPHPVFREYRTQDKERILTPTIVREQIRREKEKMVREGWTDDEPCENNDRNTAPTTPTSCTSGGRASRSRAKLRPDAKPTLLFRNTANAKPVEKSVAQAPVVVPAKTKVAITSVAPTPSQLPQPVPLTPSLTESDISHLLELESADDSFEMDLISTQPFPFTEMIVVQNVSCEKVECTTTITSPLAALSNRRLDGTPQSSTPKSHSFARHNSFGGQNNRDDRLDLSPIHGKKDLTPLSSSIRRTSSLEHSPIAFNLVDDEYDDFFDSFTIVSPKPDIK